MLQIKENVNDAKDISLFAQGAISASGLTSASALGLGLGHLGMPAPMVQHQPMPPRAMQDTAQVGGALQDRNRPSELSYIRPAEQKLQQEQQQDRIKSPGSVQAALDRSPMPPRPSAPDGAGPAMALESEFSPLRGGSGSSQQAPPWSAGSMAESSDRGFPAPQQLEAGTPEASADKALSHQQSGRASESLGGTESDEESSGTGGSSSSGGWPPKAPLQRFKMLQLFSADFCPQATEQIKAGVGDHSSPRGNTQIPFASQQTNEGKVRCVNDHTVLWVNKKFAMNITKEFEVHLGFSVIMLTILDAIYPVKVPWHHVDFKIQYKKALTTNFAILQKLWAEVNMEKVRGFRFGDTRLRIEDMLNWSIYEQLDFLRLMKHWFDARILYSGPYEPLGRRQEMVKDCRMKGYYVDFPPWVLHEKGKEHMPQRKMTAATSKTAEFNAMPEYKRLIWFLGSAEHQAM